MKGDTIIDNYKDLPIGTYADIVALCRRDMDELDRQVAIIALLTGRTEDEVLDLPVAEFQALASRLAFLEKPLDASPRPAKQYSIGGMDLVPVTDMRKVTTAQYIDFQTFHQAGMEEHFVEILSCLLVPKGRRYAQDYDVADVQRAIRGNLSVHDAMSLYAFFLISSKKSIADMLTYSRREAEGLRDPEARERTLAEIARQEELLRSAGAGSPTSTR